MPASPDEPPAHSPFTVDELRAAVRLIDPNTAWPDELYEQIASAPDDSPWLLPYSVGVALTVVSDRLRRSSDEWLAKQPAAVRAAFSHDRETLMRVARGEAPPPGWDHT